MRKPLPRKLRRMIRRAADLQAVEDLATRRAYSAALRRVRRRLR